MANEQVALKHTCAAVAAVGTRRVGGLTPPGAHSAVLLAAPTATISRLKRVVSWRLLHICDRRRTTRRTTTMPPAKHLHTTIATSSCAPSYRRRCCEGSASSRRLSVHSARTCCSSLAGYSAAVMCSARCASSARSSTTRNVPCVPRPPIRRAPSSRPQTPRYRVKGRMARLRHLHPLACRPLTASMTRS